MCQRAPKDSARQEDAVRGWTILVAFFLTVVGMQAPTARVASAEVPASVRKLAENAFRSADSAKKGYLDEPSLREARRILRGALESDVKRNFPAGQWSAAVRVFRMVVHHDPDTNRDEKTTLEEFRAFVAELTKERDKALQQAEKKAEKDRQGAIKVQQDRYEDWLRQLQRELARELWGSSRRRRR